MKSYISIFYAAILVKLAHYHTWQHVHYLLSTSLFLVRTMNVHSVHPTNLSVPIDFHCLKYLLTFFIQQFSVVTWETDFKCRVQTAKLTMSLIIDYSCFE